VDIVNFHPILVVKYLSKFFHITFLRIGHDSFHAITSSFLGKARGKFFSSSVRKKMLALKLGDFVNIRLFIIRLDNVFSELLIVDSELSEGLEEPIVG
jgi:hypothetical protein